MANTLGTIAVDLQANTVAFVEGMTRASSAAKKAGRDITDSFSRLGDLAGSALAPFGEVGRIIGETIGRIGALGGSATQSLSKMSGGMSLLTVGGGIAAGAIAAVEVGVIGLTIHTAEAAAKMLVLSQTTGVSVEALSGLSFVAKQSGVDSEVMTNGLTKLNKAIFAAATASPDAVNAFTRLHIAVRDSAGQIRDTEEVFRDVADKFANMADGPTKGALAIQIFGKAGAGLIPILNQGKAGIDSFLETAKALGIVLDRETAEAAHKFEQSLNLIGAAGQGIAIHLMRELVPALQLVADKLVEALKDKESMFNKIIDAVVWLTKVTFALGDTFLTTFSALGRAAGYSLAQVEELGIGLKAMAKAANPSELVSAFTESRNRLKAIDDRFLADNKKAWQDNANFIGNLLGPRAPYTTTPPRSNTAAVDTDAKEKDKSLDSIKRQVEELLRKTQAELALAASTNQSTAAQRLQAAAGEADLLIGRLQAEADSKKGAEKAKLIAYINSETEAIRAATAEQLVAKDAISLNKEFAKVTEAYNAQVVSLQNLTIAYLAGGNAIASAEIEQKLEGEKEKLAILNEEFAILSKQQGVSSAATFDLAVAIDNANKQLAFHEQQLRLVNEQHIDVEIAKAADALRGETPLVLALNDAYMESAAAIRDAEVALKTFQFTQANPGASQSQIDEMRAQYKALSDQAYQTRVIQEAAQLSLSRGFEDEIAKLLDVREALRAYGEDTIRVDAAIYDAQTKNIQQWDAAALKVGTYGEKFRAVMNQVVLDGQNLGQKLFESIGKVINDLSSQLAKFVVTGKNDFRSMIQGFEESIVKASFQKLFSTVVSKLGLGGIGGAAKRDGSSESSALYVQLAGGAGKVGIPAGDGGDNSGDNASSGSFSDIISSVGSKISGVFSSIVGSISGIISKIGSAFGSIFSSFGGIFGGFLASGGDVTPGKAYVVGEKHPEFFVPKQAGQVTPSLKTGGGTHHTSVAMHIHGVSDFDSFRRSSGQIMAGLQRQIAIAHSRNS